MDVLGDHEAVTNTGPFGHGFPVAGLVGVHEDEVDLAFESEGGVTERGKLVFTCGAPGGEEVNDGRGAIEVRDANTVVRVVLIIEDRKVERRGGDIAWAAIVGSIGDRWQKDEYAQDHSTDQAD